MRFKRVTKLASQNSFGTLYATQLGSSHQGRRRRARLRAAKGEAFYTQRSSKLDSNQRPANVDALEEMTARSAEAMAGNKQQVDVAGTIRAKVDRDMFR